jgi:thioredoxin 1
MKRHRLNYIALGAVLIMIMLASVLTACSGIANFGKEESEMPVIDSKVVTITDSNFESEISSGITLVDFWAPWCGPCKTQGPIIDKVALQFDGKAKVAKYNVDENKDIAIKFGIRSIPTLMVFKDGEEMERMVGLQQEKTLIDKLNAISGQN